LSTTGTNGNLTVAGTSTLNGNTAIAGTLSTTGTNGNLTVAGTSTLNGNTAIADTLSIIGIRDDYAIEVTGSSSNANTSTSLRIRTASISIDNRTGINTTILNPDGSYKAKVTHDVWETWGNWQAWETFVTASAADGDVVVVASSGAVRPVLSLPESRAVTTLLEFSGAVYPFSPAFQANVSYALVFVKGRKMSAQEMFERNGNVAVLRTSYKRIASSLLIRGNTAIAGTLSVTGSNGNLIVAGTSTLTGKVGIGGDTSTGTEKLKVTGDAAIAGDLYLGNNTNNQKFVIHPRTSHSGDFLQITSDAADGNWAWREGIILKRDGNVSIGTIYSQSSKAKLEVEGQRSWNVTGATKSYLNQSPLVENLGTSLGVSIYASNRIVCDAVSVFSDKRIKNIQGRSESASDLNTLLGIEITDFRYKDMSGKSNASHKKVIGQQVEKVFPQSVSKHIDVVPDIYQLAPITDGLVALATDLKLGDRVKLIAEQGEEGIYEVIEVAEDKFRTAFKPKGDKVFVFGREVNDFRIVDYDAIAMLNVSATQELYKRLDRLQLEVEQLQASLYQVKPETLADQASNGQHATAILSDLP
ncbi:tail fiber domain-containing protein, partial [Microcoleus sp. Pol11C2]|uniref:tail fiber domain-containing protein n=1 Tax=Microcoleus sp. Pol11C2 TaxID=3055389 RepID=UPI002FD4F7CE